MNKWIKYLMVGAVAAGVALSSYGAAITVNSSAAVNTFLTLADGTYIPTADPTVISIGTFASTPTDGSSSLAGFTAFATTTINNGDGSWSTSSTADEGIFSHQQIDIVVQENTVNQLGIFYVNMANNTTWKFPAGTDVQNFTTMDLQDLLANPNGVNTSLATGAHIVWGSSAVTGDTFNQLRLAVVPEPSSIMLVAVGLLGMFGLMRRRS